MTREEFKQAFKNACACADEYDCLIRAKTDAEFWGVALANYDWCMACGLGTAEEFLAAGANVNAATVSGWTALMFAALFGHVDTVKMLIAAGADVNAAPVSGWTALMSAARYGHVDIVKMLIAAGADANVVDTRGRTALMNAAMFGRADIVNALLAAGADANVVDNNGGTPLTEAARYGHIDVVKTLFLDDEIAKCISQWRKKGVDTLDYVRAEAMWKQGEQK